MKIFVGGGEIVLSLPCLAVVGLNIASCKVFYRYPLLKQYNNNIIINYHYSLLCYTTLYVLNIFRYFYDW